MSDCLFCKIAAGEIPADKIYEDERVVVFRDINPKAEVHLLIVPREHIAGLNELESGHDALIAHIMRLIQPLALDQGLESGYRTIINTGKDGGQEVFHLHIHLLGGRDLPGFG
ncbi:MAG: histidine triad nucleotide-binding protein [Gammaproteobacteria bacterium]|nr:histidine triad nucleotide-binding protein [Gammaproteobacteria bacterium]